MRVYERGCVCVHAWHAYAYSIVCVLMDRELHSHLGMKW